MDFNGIEKKKRTSVSLSVKAIKRIKTLHNLYGVSFDKLIDIIVDNYDFFKEEDRLIAVNDYYGKRRIRSVRIKLSTVNKMEKKKVALKRALLYLSRPYNFYLFANYARLSPVIPLVELEQIRKWDNK